MTAISALENQTDTAQKAQGAFGLYDMIYAKPFDQVLVQEIFSQYSCVVTLEDGVIQGGFGQSLAAYCNTTTPGERTRKKSTPPPNLYT
jgi:deoxyxylulose-5-phosphate synthase